MYFKSQESLPNGLRLVVIDIPHFHRVEVTLFIKVGSAYETKETNGLSHFLEHVLLRGPKRYSNSAEFKQFLGDFGVKLRAKTFKECTFFQLVSLPRDVTKTLVVLAEMLTAPRFNEIEMEAERQIILEEILDYLGPGGIDVDIDEIASAILWPSHPLGMKITGTPRNIKKFGSSDLKAHFKRFYCPNNMVLCIVGGTKSRKNLTGAVRKYFSFLKGKAIVKMPKVTESQEAPQISFVENTGKSQLDGQLCFRAFSHNHPQGTALQLLNSILAGDESSRLPISLCEKQGLVYRVYSIFSTFSKTGTLDINFSVSPEKLVSVIKEILLEVGKLIKGVSPAELARAKKRKERDIIFSLDEPEYLSEIFGSDLLLGRVKTPEKKLEEVKKVTIQDIQSLAKRIFVPQRLNYVIVGPYKENQKSKVENIMRAFKG